MTPFLAHSAPLDALAAGRLEEASELAGQVLAADPNAPEAHLCLGLIALGRQDDAAIAAFKACLTTRPAEWLLERLRAEFDGKPISVRRDLAIMLGRLLRTRLSPLGAVSAPDARRARHPFINVVGTSYVRSFGASTAIFPLFIGMGPTMLMLSEEQASLTRRKFSANLRRVDPNRTTLLVLGGDAYYHALAHGKARSGYEGELSAEDEAVMDLVAHRHAPLLADARSQLQGRIFLLGGTPTFTPFVDRLARRLDVTLAAVCADQGVELLDCWAALADPETGLLRRDYSANAYPDDIHYSLDTVPIFLQALRDKGALDPAISPEADYEWASVFECEVDVAERTRIWCEPAVNPRNAVQSDKVAASHLYQRVAELVASFAVYGRSRSLVAVNVRDGYPIVAIPPQLLSGVLAFTDTPRNAEAAHMVLDFFGRSDATIEAFGPQATEPLRGAKVWALLLLINPETAEADEERCNAALAALAPGGLVFVGTAHPDRIDKLTLSPRQQRLGYNVANRHIPEKWRDYSIFVFY